MRVELRFGTVASVAGRDAMVRFPGMADPVPVRCVESLPVVGQKIGALQTAQRLYYLGGGVAAVKAAAAASTDFADFKTKMAAL